MNWWQKRVLCDHCDGSKVDNIDGDTPCHVCAGRGWLQEKR